MGKKEKNLEEEEIVPAVLEDSGCEGDGGKTKKKKKGKKEKVAKEEVPVCPTTSSNANTHQHTTPQTKSATGKKKKSTIKEEKTTGGGEKDISFGFPGSNILSIEGYGVFCSSSNDANTHQPTTPNIESVAEKENKFTIKEEKTTGSTIEEVKTTGSIIEEEETSGGGENDISFGFPGSNIMSIEGYGVF